VAAVAGVLAPSLPRKLLYVVNEAYFMVSHRLAVAAAAQRDGWEIHVAAPPDHVWAPPGFSVAQLEGRGIHFHPIPLSRRGTNPVAELATAAALLGLYRRLRPDLVHHVTLKPILYGGMAARLAGVHSAVHSLTGLGQVFVGRGPRSGLLRTAVTQMLSVALGHPNSRVIFQNADDRRRIIEAGSVEEGRTVLIRGSGVDLTRFAPLPEPDGIPVIALCARLIWEKGVGEFVEAARIVRRHGTQARFVLVGDTQPSNPRAVPVTTLAAWRAEGAVEWWGYRDDMPAVIASASVICLPSTYGEGVPKVLLEAAASGRPIVATDHPGCRDAVTDGNGLLVPPADAVALAAALTTLIEDANLRRAMGARGRELAEREFSELDIAEETLQVYRELSARAD
jgi:glycosyltransferase involved in cell wall biosynthesis